MWTHNEKVRDIHGDKLRKGKAKLSDVARLAGVSVATVSRVLNNPDIVRPALREKVRRAVRELSYTRDITARALKSGRTQSIGAVVPTLGIGILADGIEALQNRLSEHDYMLLVGNSQYDPEKELQEVRALLERGVDGLVLVGDSASPETYALIERYAVPTVVTYVCASAHGIPAIGIDNARATYELTNYLLGLGHREFGVIANSAAPNDRATARRDGVAAALADKGLALPREQIVEVALSLANGRSALRKLIALNPQITAIVCTNDALAIGALAECRMLGLVVPRDLSVSGFDNADVGLHIDPPLTTVDVPAAEMGRHAADHLVAAIAGGPIPLVTQLPARLIIRGSTGKAPPRQDAGRRGRPRGAAASAARAAHGAG